MRSGSSIIGAIVVILGLVIGCTQGPREGRQTVGESWNNGESRFVSSPFQFPEYNREVSIHMEFTTSLGQQNCLAIGQSVTLDYDLYVNVGDRPASGWHSTRQLGVDSYDRNTDSVIIRTADGMASLGRSQPLPALHREIVFDAAGQSHTYSETGDFFKFSGVSGENPDLYCFEQIGTSRTLYLEISE